jgi:GNAT superfamily N-acetyltransferase
VTALSKNGAPYCIISINRSTIGRALPNRPANGTLCGNLLKTANVLRNIGRMNTRLSIRLATPADAAAMARIHVATWQETYRGLMTDEVLDDSEFVSARQRFWTIGLTDERFAHHRVAVAEFDGELIGIAQSAEPTDADATWSQQLNILYVLASAHGTGAGKSLLEAVLFNDAAAALWVADSNPRAQAFYRKHDFIPDGTAKEEYGIKEIRMVRRGQSKLQASECAPDRAGTRTRAGTCLSQ